MAVCTADLDAVTGPLHGGRHPPNYSSAFLHSQLVQVAIETDLVERFRLPRPVAAVDGGYTFFEPWRVQSDGADIHMQGIGFHASLDDMRGQFDPLGSEPFG
jgi:hypothetical protein